MLDDIIKERLKKRETLIQSGARPYPSSVSRSAAIGTILSSFRRKALFRRPVSVAGRIVGYRNQGGVFFVDVRDESGTIQGVGTKKNLADFNTLRDTTDIGDFANMTGVPFTTKKGEKSLRLSSFACIAKSLRPLPSQWHGFNDVEERFRKRYLDLNLNPDVKGKLLVRSRMIAAWRNILVSDGFMEVETPILQALPGGATARPFITHHNALDVDFYLRIAPELYLKRLLVGGFEKIFEIGRNFRNEGIDRDHNPEFTMMELYWAYQDYRGLMKAVQQWLLAVLDSLNISAVPYGDQKISFQGEWPVMTYQDAIQKYAGKDVTKLAVEEIDELFKKSVRPNLIQPVFIVRHPTSISPLAKACTDNPFFSERFQLVVAGTELINGFSELNDPVEQRARMTEQEKRFRAGDAEASRFDADFIEALEYGMPPAAGLGIGMDRLAALLTGSHAIKEVIMFPTLRPKNEE